MQQITLSNIFHPVVNDTHKTGFAAKQSLLLRINQWLNGQEGNRFFWLGMSLIGSICTVLPLTLFAIVFGGDNNFTLWIITCIVNVPVLVLNLAALSPKFTLPVLFFAWFIDAIIIIGCAVFFITG